ncbi:MAG: DsrE family protein [Thiobacillaceae bacterium]|jgi:predicted peroxiredoxin
MTPSTEITSRPGTAKLDFKAPFQSFAVQESGAPYCTIILTAGIEDGGVRATLALSMACTALSMDMDTHVFLVGSGRDWVYQGQSRKVRIDGFPDLQELFAEYLTLGGSVAVCAACEAAHCGSPYTAEDSPRWPGIQVQGMATVMERVIAGRVVTF